MDSKIKEKKQKEIKKAGLNAGAGKRLVEMGIMSDSTSEEEEPYYNRITKIVEEPPQDSFSPTGGSWAIQDDKKTKSKNSLMQKMSTIHLAKLGPSKGLEH